MISESDENTFNQLLAKIFQAAKERNISQKELAIRAGITPETLSRMKTRGSGDFGVINEMAIMTGLRLTLVPDGDTLNAIREGNLF
jgi:transcriptional regulator with XRE-family HTH domain